jgi:type I restriction enzyme S subunit
MSEWKEYKLGEISDITKLSGFEFTEHFNYTEDGEIIALRALNVRDGVLDLDNVKRIKLEVSNKLVRSKLFSGDILFTYVGANIGQFALIKENNKFHLAPNICRIRVNQICDPYFLYTYFRSKDFQYVLKNFAVGSSQPTLPMGNLRKVPIKIPPIRIQLNISSLFSSIDNKIELNNKINQELEALAQTLFKQWFIDFEFPNENGEPYKSFGGEMVESELGEIPKGWEIIQISDVLDFISGFPFKGESYSKIGKYGIVTIKNVQDGKFVQYTDNYIDELPNRLPNNAILHIGDILMSLTGNVGRVCFVTKENCVLNQRVVKFKGKQENSNAFWYYFFRQNPVKDLLISISKGTAQLNLSPVETRTLKFILPKIINEKLLAPFIEMFNIEVACSVENETLTILRDTLLPKLISGELDINETNN